MERHRVAEFAVGVEDGELGSLGEAPEKAREEEQRSPGQGAAIICG